MTLTKRERRILSGGDRRSFLARALPLSPIGDMAGATLSEIEAETITWSTSTDWNNAVDESYVSHSSDVINLERGEDSFEDLANGDPLPAAYDINPGGHNVTDGFAYDGSISVRTTSDNPFGVSGFTATPDVIRYAYRETSSQKGHSVGVFNENGNLMFAAGTTNPAAGIYAANGGNGISVNEDYQEWYLVEFILDYANDQFDYTYTNTNDSVSDTGTLSFRNSATSISRVDVESRGIDLPSNGTNDGGMSDSWHDLIFGTYRDGFLMTATKSFSSTVSPDLTDLIYTLNGETITLDVIGSPGTASEEVVSQTLDGSSGFTLTWSNTHSDFRIKANLSTAARDGTSLPSIDQLRLIA